MSEVRAFVILVGICAILGFALGSGAAWAILRLMGMR